MVEEVVKMVVVVKMVEVVVVKMVEVHMMMMLKDLKLYCLLMVSH